MVTIGGLLSGLIGCSPTSPQPPSQDELFSKNYLSPEETKVVVRLQKEALSSTRPPTSPAKNPDNPIDDKYYHFPENLSRDKIINYYAVTPDTIQRVPHYKDKRLGSCLSERFSDSLNKGKAVTRQLARMEQEACLITMANSDGKYQLNHN